MAVLQFEIDLSRLSGYDKEGIAGCGNNSLISGMLCRVVRDTLRNGGTFVLVVSETTITAVQHADAKPLEADE
jgi:hypothetical protein